MLTTRMGADLYFPPPAAPASGRSRRKESCQRDAGLPLETPITPRTLPGGALGRRS
jgi:hypothetical protein